MQLHEKLIILRNIKGLSIKASADFAGVSEATLREYEEGRSKPAIDKLVELATLFGVSTDTLLRNEINLDVRKDKEQKVEKLINYKENQNMNELSRETGNNGTFVAYEYAVVEVKKERESLYNDCYKNFGWERTDTKDSLLGFGTVNLKFKRNRKIEKRSEINELQTACEKSLIEIERLEKSKTSTATAVATVVGLVGVAFVAGATFSYLAGMLALMIPLAVVGFGICAVPYFIYKKIKSNKTAKAEKLIDEQYNVIYSTGEKASAIIQ